MHFPTYLLTYYEDTMQYCKEPIKNSDIGARKQCTRLAVVKVQNSICAFRLEPHGQCQWSCAIIVTIIVTLYIHAYILYTVFQKKVTPKIQITITTAYLILLAALIIIFPM